MQTFTAGDAVFYPGSLHMRRKSALRHFKHIGADNFKTGLDATETHDTSIEPLPNQRGSIRYPGKFPLLPGILITDDSEFIRPVLKLTFPSGIADRTFDRMVDE
jgi:hypothetical protein